MATPEGSPRDASERSVPDLFESFDLNVRPWHVSRKPHFVRVVPMLTTGRRFEVDRSARARPES